MKLTIKLVPLIITFLLLNNLCIAKVQPPLQHAKRYQHNVTDIQSYWLSEKLDGIRGYWNGNKLFTRQGNIINSPSWFTKNWPKTALDGELWIARNKFEQTLSCIAKATPDNACWRQINYMVFDLPASKEIFEIRIKKMIQLAKHINSPHLKIIKQEKIASISALEKRLDAIVKSGGEGLMLHKGDALYTKGRTAHLLKVKKVFTDEAKVIAHIPGKGKYQAMLGSIEVETTDGKRFKLGTGFSIQERKNPPPIGAIITYQYLAKTKNGIPKFASFVRFRSDF